EKALITGMAGEPRTKVTRYLAVRDTPDEYFPRIESMRDNLGNVPDVILKKPVLRVGDVVEFIAEAWDPEGKELEFQWVTIANLIQHRVRQDWSTNSRFRWQVEQ